jgi:excisionase family DNA binding protein
MDADRPGLGHNGGPALDNVLSMTVRDACKATGFSRDAIYDLINDGSVKSFLMGHRRFVDAASLRAYVAARASEPLQSGRAPVKRRHGRRVEEGIADPPTPFSKSRV